MDFVEDLTQRSFARDLEYIAAGLPRHLLERPRAAAPETALAVVEASVVVPHAVDDHIRLVRGLDGFLAANSTTVVHAVGNQYDRLTTHLLTHHLV